MTKTLFPRVGAKHPDGAGYSSYPSAENTSLNAPTLVVQEGGVDTHAEDEGADLTVLATTDDGDGATTSDVELYINSALDDSMTDDGGGDWSRADDDVTPGTYNYRAKRITDLGFRWSATWQVVVSPVVTGNQVIAGADRVVAGADPVVANA